MSGVPTLPRRADRRHSTGFDQGSAARSERTRQCAETGVEVGRKRGKVRPGQGRDVAHAIDDEIPTVAVIVHAAKIINKGMACCDVGTSRER